MADLLRFARPWQINILSGQMSRFEAELKNEGGHFSSKIKNREMAAFRNFDDEIDIALYQDEAEKTN